MIQNTLEVVGATTYEIFLSDSENNFRRFLDPTYKANRIQPKPAWLEDLKEYLIVKHHAKISVGQEADDALGITQSTATEDTIICSIDKDLKQISGKHYNFVKQEFDHITPFKGTYNFYTQLLVGDVADNVKGVIGIGPIKACKALMKCESEQDMFKVVQRLFKDDGRLLITGQLLKIRTYEGEMWKFPKLDEQQPSQDSQSLSTIPQEAETIPSMEPIPMETEDGLLPLGVAMDKSSEIGSAT